MASTCSLHPTIGGVKGAAYVLVSGKLRRVTRSELLRGELRDGVRLDDTTLVAFGVDGHVRAAQLSVRDPELLLGNYGDVRSLVTHDLPGVQHPREQLWVRSRTPAEIAAKFATDPEFASRVAPAVVAERLAVFDMADDLHREWRQTLPVVPFQPRVKDDGSGGWVDIANTSFTELPPKWQKENLDAASGAVTAALSIDAGRSDRVDAIAEQIHIQWLERNGAWAPAEQQLPYDELSDAEQEKDRILSRRASAGVDTGVELDGLAVTIAGEMHDEWRQGRRGDGWREARVLRDGSGFVDVANTDFVALSPELQYDNVELAEDIVDVLRATADRELADEQVHRLRAERVSRMAVEVPKVAWSDLDDGQRANARRLAEFTLAALDRADQATVESLRVQLAR